MHLRTLLVIFAIVASTFASAQKVLIDISGIKNTNGSLLIGIFQNQEQFNKEVPYKSIKVSKSSIKSGKKTVSTTLPSGTYAITILDDEDGSGDMSYRFRVYPQEGVGFSNYRLKGLSKPKFTEFDFVVGKKDSRINVVIDYF